MVRVLASINISLYFINTLTAPSTVAMLGMPLSTKHDSFRNKRALQDGVHTQKEKEASAGLQWNGMLSINFFHFWH